MAKLLSLLKIPPRSWWTYLRINLFSGKVVRGCRHPFKPLGRTVVQLDEGARLELNAQLATGYRIVKRSRAESRILLMKDARMTVDGGFELAAQGYIMVRQGGELVLHGGYLNEHVQIIAGERIEIGEDFTCGRDVVIRNYDGHYLDEPGFRISEPITIGKHVWVGQGATILKGVTIGDGAVIAAGALVTRDVPAHALAAGVPAKVLRENISWHD